MSKTSSKSFRGLTKASAWIACVVILGCATTVSGPPTPPYEKAPVETKKPVQMPEKPPSPQLTPSVKQPSPRAVASLQLTEQAQMLLQANQTDEAIRVLEQAINVNPSNGQNYYYLAEAWIKKGNIAQAVEFNRLAGIYLTKDPDWMAKVVKQKRYLDEKTK
jgi:tetratricopeptide (TPR) repeat protein